MLAKTFCNEQKLGNNRNGLSFIYTYLHKTLPNRQNKMRQNTIYTEITIYNNIRKMYMKDIGNNVHLVAWLRANDAGDVDGKSCQNDPCCKAFLASADESIFRWP